MKTKIKNLNPDSGKVLFWVVPILIVQSIAIVILVMFMIDANEDKTQNSAENEVSINPTVIPSAIPKTEKNEQAQTSNSFQSSNNPQASTKTKPAEITFNNETIKKQLNSEEQTELPIADSRKNLNQSNNHQIPLKKEIALNNQVEKLVGDKIPAQNLSDPKKQGEEVAVNQKAKGGNKNKKVEVPPNQVVNVIPKPIPEKKPDAIPIKKNIEPKAVVAQAEATPVDFEIPEIKDDTGAFTLRSNIGRNEAVSISGGSLETETGVDMALAWLAIHQESDGHWDSGKHEGTFSSEYDLACTGAALMAFLSAGQTDSKGEWSQTVKLGIGWLIKAQKINGSWDSRNYTNGICTMTITEAAAMGCGGEEVKKSAVLAVDFILKQQNSTGCFDYKGNSTRDDMSVTGWCITALKSGALANIKRKEIGEAYEKLKLFLDVAEGTKDISPTSKGLAWYTPTTIGSGVAGGACQAIAMFVNQQIGRENTEPTPWLIAAADGQISKLPIKYDSPQANVYRIYYTYLTLRQMGGKHWVAWNEPVSKMIIAAQRQDGDFRGSWDKNKSSIDKAGRVMYTAFLCLCLEIYYRYPTVF